MATASRYATAQTNPTGTSTQGTGSTSGSSQTSGSQSSNTQQNSVNMDERSLSVLNTLIQQLMTGGTPELQAQKGARQAELASLVTQRGGYSKEAAFADAQGLMAQMMRQTIEKMMPSINAGAIGAGASQSSMRALLTQRAAENAAQNATAQGLGAAVSYGGVANGMSGAIANLLGQTDPVTAALMNALNLAKGAVTSSTTQQSGTTQQTQQTQQQSKTNENKQIGYDGSALPSSSGSGGLSYFGPVEQNSTGGANNSTESFLRELYKAQPFGDITF